MLFFFFIIFILPFILKKANMNKGAPQAGFEPATDRLTVDSSTAELLGTPFRKNYLKDSSKKKKRIFFVFSIQEIEQPVKGPENMKISNRQEPLFEKFLLLDRFE